MSVSLLPWFYFNGVFFSMHATIQSVYALIPPQTSSVGLSSFRTLRCPQWPPLSKCPRMVTSSWQQVGCDPFLLSANMTVIMSCCFFWTERLLTPHRCFCGLFHLGTYKPRIRCYDTHQLSLKFERCLDSDGKSETPIFFLSCILW